MAGTNETGTITLKLVVQDLMTGNVGKAVGSLDKLAQKGGLVGSVAQGVGQSFGQMLNPMALMGKGLGMVTDFLGDAGAAASDLNETQSKLSAVFKSQADEIRAWAADSAQAMGLSTQAALEATGTFGNFLQAMGQAEPAAAEMSKTMVQLAADLGSFNNADPSEVLLALRSGLSGETEPLRKFGVDISDAAVVTELLAQGVQAVNGKFTQAQKIQGRYNLIMRQTITAQGDYGRTATGTANATKSAAAQTENFKAKLGELVNNVQNVAVSLAGTGALALTNSLDAVGVAWNDLMRLMNPGLAFEQDVDEAIRKQAVSLGLNSAALIEFSDAQREAFKQGTKAAELHSNQMELAAIALNIIGDATAEDTARMEEWIRVNVAAEDQIAATTQATDGLTEAQRAAAVMVSAFVAAGQPVPETLRDIAGASETVGTTMTDVVKVVGRAATEIPKSIGDGLRAQKSKVREAMVALKYEMTHPVTAANVRAYADGVIHSKRLAKGIRSGIPAIRDAAIRAWGAARLARDGYMFDRRYGDGPTERRASGGPVGAGRTYLVGEQGPELLTMGSQAGHIVPNKAMGGVTININAGAFMGSPIEAQRYAAMLVPELRRAGL